MTITVTKECSDSCENHEKSPEENRETREREATFQKRYSAHAHDGASIWPKCMHAFLDNMIIVSVVREKLFSTKNCLSLSLSLSLSFSKAV